MSRGIRGRTTHPHPLARFASDRSSLRLRVLAWVGLLGQLALLADGAATHVICVEHGDLVHASPRAGHAVAARHDTLLAAADAGSETHDRCLLDEDGEAACPNEPHVVPAPVLAAGPRPDFRGAERRPARRAPLYRLAPKNSPPA